MWIQRSPRPSAEARRPTQRPRRQVRRRSQPEFHRSRSLGSPTSSSISRWDHTACSRSVRCPLHPPTPGQRHDRRDRATSCSDVMAGRDPAAAASPPIRPAWAPWPLRTLAVAGSTGCSPLMLEPEVPVTEAMPASVAKHGEPAVRTEGAPSRVTGNRDHRGTDTCSRRPLYAAGRAASRLVAEVRTSSCRRGPVSHRRDSQPPGGEPADAGLNGLVVHR